MYTVLRSISNVYELRSTKSTAPQRLTTIALGITLSLLRRRHGLRELSIKIQASIPISTKKVPCARAPMALGVLLRVCICTRELPIYVL